MKENNLKNTYFLAYGAVIAAIYVALTMAFQPISFGPVQFRISEALCILPFFTPAAIPGLFVGCFLSNLFCGAAGLDIVFGSLATLIGAVGSYALRRSKVLGLPDAGRETVSAADVQLVSARIRRSWQYDRPSDTEICGGFPVF